ATTVAAFDSSAGSTLAAAATPAARRVGSISSRGPPTTTTVASGAGIAVGPTIWRSYQGRRARPQAIARDAGAEPRPTSAHTGRPPGPTRVAGSARNRARPRNCGPHPFAPRSGSGKATPRGRVADPNFDSGSSDT